MWDILIRDDQSAKEMSVLGEGRGRCGRGLEGAGLEEMGGQDDDDSSERRPISEGDERLG